MRHWVRAIGTGLLVATLAGSGVALSDSPFTQSNSNGWFSGLGKLFGGSENQRAGQSAQAMPTPNGHSGGAGGPTGGQVQAPASPGRSAQPKQSAGEPAPHGQ